MRELLGHYVEPVREELEKYLVQSQKEVFPVTDLAEPVYALIKDYVEKGKCLRGALVLFSYECYEDEYSQEALRAAVAIELVNAALLIQDDIMDKSILRRGGLALHKSLEGLGKKYGFQETQKTGESLALCAADALLFIAYRILDIKLIELFSKELHKTAFGQMADIAGAAQKGTLSKEAILKIYQYKTARYTFSLPLAAGAILAKKDPEKLAMIGEEMGMVYNLRDDYLDFTDTSGKDKGSDFKENKQTIYRFLLSQKTKERTQDFNYYVRLLKEFGIFKEVDQVVLEYHERILKNISELEIKKKDELAALATRLLTRSK